MDKGSPFKGEVVSADASAGVAFTLYPDGNTTAFTLGSTQFLTITDIIFVSTVGGVYSIAADTQAAGKYIAKGNADALGGLAHSFSTPLTCPKGVTPKLFAAAGQVDCVISGYVKDA